MTERRTTQGFILITVLLVIVLLSGLVLAFNRQTQTSLQQLNESGRRAKALNAARSGLHLVMAALAGRSDLHSLPEWREAFTAEKTVPFADLSCALQIRLENGKMNVNHLVTANGQLDRPRVDQLLQLIDLLNGYRQNGPPIGYGLVPALVDWLDPDDQVTHFDFVRRDNRGAEKSHYLQNEPPYACANGPFSFLEQLLWVKGIEAPSFHGKGQRPGLKQFLTVYGPGEVDVNSADPLLLQSLSPRITPALAQRIVNQRKDKPFTSLAQLQTFAGLSPASAQALARWVTINPEQAYYTVRSSVTVGNCKQAILATLERHAADQSVTILLYREIEKIVSQ